MIPINLMPFFAYYWPYILAGVFFYTILYISIDKTREATQRDEDKIQKRKEAADVDDDDDEVNELDEDMHDQEIDMVPYKAETYSEV